MAPSHRASNAHLTPTRVTLPVMTDLLRRPLQVTIRDALNSALDEEMDKDKDVYILGEEVTPPPPLTIWACQQMLHTISAALMHGRICAGGGVSGRLQGMHALRAWVGMTASSLANNIVCLEVCSMLMHLFVRQITRGLLQKYGPDRVKDTPITEVRQKAA